MSRVGDIYIQGAIGKFDGEKCVELVDIVAQVNMQKDAQAYNVYIDSPGGYVDVGFKIHDYLKSLKKPITTIGQNLVASMGTVIFMAGDRRVLQPNTEFMIHLPLGGIDGNSEEIAEYSKFMQDTEKEIIKFYKDTTGLSEEAIKPLLSAETWLDTTKAFELGFSTVAPQGRKAIAKFNLKSNTMSKKDKIELSKDETNMINSFFKTLGKMFSERAKNIVLQDANGVSIDFTEVEEGQTVALGDMATVDGAPAEGSYVMPPNGDTYVFVAGELTEIIVSGAEDDALEDLQSYLDKIAELESSNKTLTTEKETLNKDLSKEKERADGAESKLATAKLEFNKFKETLKTEFNFTGIKKEREEEQEMSASKKALSKLKNKN